MTTTPEGPAPPLPGDGVEIDFTGRRAPLMWLLLKNSLLTVLTIGVYRFWAKTRVRRYFWGHVRIQGDALEYTGLPSELFIGFLIAIAVLVPVGSVYGTFDALLGPADAGPRAVLVFTNLIVLLTLFQVAFYRMWRYRLTRTAWRGIRFGLDGSTWHYLWLSAGWLVLVALTLGLAYPWMQVALWRYRVRHTRFGATYFGFAGDAMALLLPWLVVYAIPAALLALAAVSGPEPAVAAAIATPFAYLWYRIRQGRYLIGHTRLGRGRFESKLAVAPLLLAFLAVGACLGALFAAMAMPIVAAAAGESRDEAAFLVIFFIIGFIVLLPVITGAILRFELLRQLCLTTVLDDPDALEHAIQSAKDAPRYGEGLADAFDVGAI